MALNAGFTGEIVMALGGWKSGQIGRYYAAVADQTLGEPRRAQRAWEGEEREVGAPRATNFLIRNPTDRSLRRL